MRTIALATAILLLISGVTFAASSETIVNLETETGTLEGTLLVPQDQKDAPVALIIAGSGPTDRDGNNATMKNNSLKMLATALQEHGIATLRYDKRGVGQSRQAAIAEEDLRFEHFIEDVKGWIAFLENDKRFGSIMIIGHSQGSLLGMIAAQGTDVEKFISMAGLGQSADLAIREQLASQPPFILEMASPILDQLAQGNTVSDVPPMLNSLFRPSMQQFLLSYIKYDPRKEIAKLDIPVLIIQGTTDIQVSEKDARMLAEANPHSQMSLIPGMNHVLKEADPDRMKNLQTYNQPDLPIMPELVDRIVVFVEEDQESRD